MINKLTNSARKYIEMTVLKRLVVISLVAMVPVVAGAQASATLIFSKNALYAERVKIDANIRSHIKTFASPRFIDTSNEYQYEAACNIVAQYLIYDKDVQSGFSALLDAYPRLAYDTKRGLLEALYAVADTAYAIKLRQVVLSESHEKLFAMLCVYLYRVDTSEVNVEWLINLADKKFAGWVKQPEIIKELLVYLAGQQKQKRQPVPDVVSLFAYQQQRRQKVIYSFQRWNRDYAGLAIVQLENGRFARHADGRLMVFEQLARSGSNLPYFISNGSTPQGCYRITGTAQSKIGVIGPTTNLQLLMPFEKTWQEYLADSLMIEDAEDDLFNSAYWRNFPLQWQGYQPMREVYMAGKIGRTEIIAHGTTIDPEYYKARRFYPLTPTQGCLCAREQWNITTGRIVYSEQWNLVNAWNQTPAQKGWLYVINLNNKAQNVSRAEVELIVNNFENKQK